jgi:Flp pilus assembly protein TadD
MAQVYRATGPAGQVVAVKLLAAGTPSDDPAARARFAREVAVLSGLDHPCLPRLLDHGIDDDLGPWLAMPFITGTTLRALLSGTRLCPEGALVLLARLLDGLGALHQAGLVHRDIKPENVMLSPEGTLRLVDLGLAFQPGQVRHTEEGAVSGSVPYLSPEQIDGRGITPASDVWAVGVMAHEWITGKRPFERARPAEEVAAILSGAYKPIEGVDRRVSRELAALLASCLRQEPAQRPPDARALAAQVTRLIDWVPALLVESELVALSADPAGYQARVAAFRVAALKREADAAQVAGDTFAALRHLDRALAYRPDDPDLLARVDRVSSSAPPPAATPALPRRRPLPWKIIAVASVVALAAAALLIWRVRTPAQPKAPEPVAVETLMTDVAPAAAPAAPMPPTSGSLALTPIAAASLSNDDPPQPITEKAAPGEPLIPPELLGPAGPAAALASLRKQVADNPSDPELRVGLAMVELGNGLTKEGLARLDQVMQANPDLVTGWKARGYIALRQGDVRAAMRAFDRTIALDPRNGDYRNRGILLRRLGRTRDAYADLTRALEIDTEDDEAMKELAQIYQHVGRAGDARPLLLRLTRLHPREAEYWVDLSLVEPDGKDALAALDKALALEPDLPRAHERRCNELARLQSRDAIPACTRAAELAPGDAGIRMDLGVSRYHQGDDQGALVDMARAIAMEPKKPQFYTNRYLVHTHAGDLAAAKKDLETACQLGSDEACNELKKVGK